jgi:hypothetical protein
MERGRGKSKVNRVGTSLSNKDFFKLSRLATACNMKHTTLANIIINKYLNDSDVIKELQEEHCLYSAYRVIPINVHGSSELEFVLSENGRNDN